MKKRLSALFLVLCLLLTAISIPSLSETADASSEAYTVSEETQDQAQSLLTAVSESTQEETVSAAATSSTSGTCGTGVKWTVSSSGTKLTISGSGDMKDYDYDYESDDYEYAPWLVDYGDTITTIVVKSGVTSIGDYAFAYLWNVSAVTIADTVTSIGAYAFTECSSLKTLTIPASVKEIDEGAFFWSGLTTVTLKKGLKTIEDGAFCYCTNLTKITIPSSVTSIGDGVFEGCRSLTKIAVSSSNTKYKAVSGVLYSYSGKTLIAYPAAKSGSTYKVLSGVTKIAYAAFSNSVNLTKVSVSKTVKKISNCAFAESSVEKIVLNGDAPTFKSKAFKYAWSLTTVKYPAGNTTYTKSVRKSYGAYSVSWVYYGTGLGKPVISSVKSSSTGKIKVTLKSAASNAEGYQIKYRLKGSSTWKTVTTTSLSKTISSLKSGKTYYVKVRAYRTMSGTKYYGSYSSTKTVTVK